MLLYNHTKEENKAMPDKANNVQKKESSERMALFALLAFVAL
nr:MAG TPA: hypothetical protein [Caudoviricetes sp.]